jgi:hypothetical protein
MVARLPLISCALEGSRMHLLIRILDYIGPKYGKMSGKGLIMIFGGLLTDALRPVEPVQRKYDRIVS